MAFKHGIEGLAVDMVTGKDKNVFGSQGIEPIDVLVNGVGGSAVPRRALLGLFGRKDGSKGVNSVKTPVLAVTDVGGKFAGFVLGQDADVIDAGVGAVRERKVDDSILPTVGNRWFC